MAEDVCWRLVVRSPYNSIRVGGNVEFECIVVTVRGIGMKNELG